MLSGLSHAAENKAQAVPRVFFRGDLRASGAKRPISFPPQTSPMARARNGDDNDDDTAVRHSPLDGHLPLVFAASAPPPPPPMKEHQLQPASSTKEPKQPTEPPMDTQPAAPFTKAKKKGLLLPFKTAKSSRGTTAGGEESASAAYLTIGRPASAPAELPSPQGEDEACPRGGDGHCLSSPDLPVTPPSGDTSGDSDSRIMSTLERAKKKFSRKHMLMYGKAKNLPSPDDTTTATTTTGTTTITREKEASSPSTDVETSEANFPIPSPVCLPHLVCISARPFFKVDDASRSEWY